MRRSAPALPREHDVATRLLDELMADSNLLVARARALPLPPGGRAWVRVADSRDADAWLITWAAGSATGSHDHGDSSGIVGLLHGALVERYWLDEPAGRARQLRAGGRILVPTGRRHDVANTGPGLAISLHVYAPRLARMNFFSERTGVAV